MAALLRGREGFIFSLWTAGGRLPWPRAGLFATLFLLPRTLSRRSKHFLDLYFSSTPSFPSRQRVDPPLSLLLAVVRGKLAQLPPFFLLPSFEEIADDATSEGTLVFSYLLSLFLPALRGVRGFTRPPDTAGSTSLYLFLLCRPCCLGMFFAEP